MIDKALSGQLSLYVPLLLFLPLLSSICIPRQMRKKKRVKQKRRNVEAKLTWQRLIIQCFVCSDIYLVATLQIKSLNISLCSSSCICLYERTGQCCQKLSPGWHCCHTATIGIFQASPFLFFCKPPEFQAYVWLDQTTLSNSNCP